MTGPPPTPPPKWKTAIVTLVAVFPPVLLFNVTVVPYLGGVPILLRTLTLCVGVTSAVTWVMMPRLMPLVKNWLNAPTGGPAEAEAADIGPGRSRGARRRDNGWAGDGNTRPAWLLDMPSDEPAADPGPRYETRREAVPAAQPASWEYAPVSPTGNRHAPWYARPPAPEYRTDEHQTVEYQTDEYQTVEFQPAREQYREDDYYEEPARYDRYTERARGRGPGTGQQWR